MKQFLTAALALLMVLALCGWTGPPNMKQEETPFRFHSGEFQEAQPGESMQRYNFQTISFSWDSRDQIRVSKDGYLKLIWNDYYVANILGAPPPDTEKGVSKAQMDRFLLSGIKDFALTSDPEIADYEVGGQPARIMVATFLLDDVGVDMYMVACMFLDPKAETLYEISWVFPEELPGFDESFVAYLNLLFSISFI